MKVTLDTKDGIFCRVKAGSLGARGWAFTLIEMLLVLAVVGILGGISAVVISQNLEKTRQAKLESDVQSINRAAEVYLASGGSFEGAKEAQDVIDRMKTRISAEQQKRHAGVVTESAVDIRLEAVKMGSQKKYTGEPRAIWNPKENRFEIASAGNNGVKEFRLNEDYDTGELELDEQSRLSTMLYAAEDDSWVWDYQEVARPPQKAPTSVATTQKNTDLPGGTAPKVPLVAPIASIPGGSYLLGDFDLLLELTNPNPAGSSTIYYQINGGLQLEYTGPIAVPADATVMSVAVAASSSYVNSPARSNTYAAKSEPLLAPTITLSNPYFASVSDTTVTVTITHPNDPSLGSPDVYYTLNGGAPILYGAPFTVDRATYETTALDISTWVQSADPSYVASPTVNKLVKVQLKRPSVAISYTFSGVSMVMHATITDPNPVGAGELKYKVVGQGKDPSTVAFTTYKTVFPIFEFMYPDGYDIFSNVLALDTSKFIDSPMTVDGGVFFGIPLKDKTIFVLDVSGSMVGSRFDTVQKRMRDLVSKMDSSKQIAIVKFDATASTMLNWNRMDAAGKTLALKAVDDLATGGGTHYQLAFDQVDAILKSIKLSGGEMPEEVVFLTDGAPGSTGDDQVVRDQIIKDYEAASGGSPYYPPALTESTTQAAWIRAQNLRANYGISLSVIGIDTEGGSAQDLLKAMAEDNQGVGPLGWINEVSL